MTILFALGVLIWVGLGVVTWGSFCGHHRSANYRWLRLNTFQLVILSISGPVGFLTELAMGEIGHHFSWYPPTLEERWAYWIEKGYGNSVRDRENFENYQKQ